MKTLEITYSNTYGYTAIKGFTFDSYSETNEIYTDLTEPEVFALINANTDCVVFGF